MLNLSHDFIKKIRERFMLTIILSRFSWTYLSITHKHALKLTKKRLLLINAIYIYNR